MAKLRIHFFQHVPFEGIGCIDFWAQAKGHVLSSTKFYQNDVYPNVDNIDWLIVMGGPMSANDIGQYQWLVEEKKFIDAAIKKNKVVIGICLGSQIIAQVLGAKVFKNEKKELGWFPVTLTDAAKNHPVFESFPEPFIPFHYHNDTFELPKHATLLMSSEACTNQAFVYGKRTFAFQFHAEVTSNGLTEMIENTNEEIIADDFIQDKKTIFDNTSHISVNHNIMRNMLNKIQELT